MKIGFIGAGKMGGSILKGLLVSNFAKKEDIIDFAEINIQNLRDNDIAETEAEAMGLLSKDILTAKGNPINLAKLVDSNLKVYHP